MPRWNEKARRRGELARAYSRTGSPSVPKEMAALLDSRSETRGFQIDAAVAGKSIVDAAHWTKRHSDLLLYGRRGQERIVIVIEGRRPTLRRYH